jgi:hypothetical protein
MCAMMPILRIFDMGTDLAILCLFAFHPDFPEPKGGRNMRGMGSDRKKKKSGLRPTGVRPIFDDARKSLKLRQDGL